MNQAEYFCGVCGLQVKEDESSIQCENECMLWFHVACANLTDDQFCQLSSADVIWECPVCRDPELPDLNSVDATDVFHFDFQQNLPTPKLTIGKQFYLRLLWTYLFGIYSASVSITTAFMWHELLARRGSNDVISCLSRFIFHSKAGRTGAKWSIWWADNCPGQNKNNCIMWFFQDLIRRNVYSRIDYKFLIPGHTYGATDQVFGAIERYAVRIEAVYVPNHWYDHVRNACTGACAIEVVEMEQHFFCDHHCHLKKIYTERNKDEDKQKLDFKNIVWFNFGKGEKEVDGKLVQFDHSKEVWVRYTYDVKEEPRRVCFLKKRKQESLDTPPPALYSQYPIAIKKAKAEDLKKLVSDYVPPEFHAFYANLPECEEDSDEDC